MAVNIAIFFIFDKDDALYILVEFESDRISPRESAKNSRNGADGLNCIISVKSELIFEIYDENNHRKKNFMAQKKIKIFGFHHVSYILNFDPFPCRPVKRH